MNPGNPAGLSPLVRALFPTAVVAAELRAPGDPSLLLPGEREDIAHAAPHRIQEFAAGRLCARRALEELGVAEFALRAAADRQPLWPDGFTGSITHTDGWCAAVAAKSGEFIGLGVDSEVAGRVGARLVPRICTEAESRLLARLSPASRACAATLIFAVKEAFYKAQFPATGERLGFHDVAVEAADWDERRGDFVVRPLRPIVLAGRAGGEFCGRYDFHGGFVSAGMAINRLDRPGKP